MNLDPLDYLVRKTFQDCGAIRTGHFLLKSGKHGSTYLDKFRLFQKPSQVNLILRGIRSMTEVADPCRVIVGPTLGGALLAYHLANLVHGEALFAETSPEGGRTFRRSVPPEPGTKVFLIDDILTTGASLRETAELIHAYHLEIAGAVVLVDRSEDTPDLGFPLTSLSRYPLTSYEDWDCPMCREGLPLEQLGGVR